MVEAEQRAAEQPDTPNSADSNLTRATRILAFGNIVSKVLGLLRQMTIARVFGPELQSVYQLAVLVPMTLFEMIRGGMVESALVPTFNELAESEDRDVLWSAVSAFLSVAVVVLIGLIVVAELLYRPIGFTIGVTDLENPALQETTLRLMRFAFPAVLFLSTASIFTSLLYALKRFTIPAFLPAVFNGTIVLAAWLWREDVSILIIGMLLGAALQIVVQIPFLRDLKLRWHFDLSHPAVRKIVKLFAPVFAVLVFNLLVMMLSYKVANRTPAGDSAVSYMVNATTLIQFPYGLIVTAISAAILPTLSEKSREGDDAFKSTLSTGIRLVMALLIPAAIGLFALAHPIIDLVFGGQEFVAADVEITANALRLYAIGLPFAGIDLMLVYAAYARNDTRRPAIIGVISLAVYTILMFALLAPLGFYTLMVADMIKHITHTVLMLIVLRREIGSLRGYNIAPLAVKVVAAAGVMGAAAWYVAGLLNGRIAGNLGELITVGVSGVTGILIYATFVFLFDLKEVKDLILRR